MVVIEITTGVPPLVDDWVRTTTEVTRGWDAGEDIVESGVVIELETGTGVAEVTNDELGGGIEAVEKEVVVSITVVGGFVEIGAVVGGRETGDVDGEAADTRTCQQEYLHILAIQRTRIVSPRHLESIDWQ